mmetsp:Transcript_27817/g.58027  ORF Transcript_27817/g.58027 Transcript_27817/m.58027 type:complete len:488 (+) Transcript_27817:52-1515(+)
MRLDVVITAPVVGLGLSVILLEPQVASGFPLSGRCRGSCSSRRTTLPSRRTRRNGRRGVAVGQQRNSMQQSQHSFIPTNNVIKQHQDDNISIRSHTRLSASISKEEEEYIDAIVEEKTAGLAVEDDGENTSAKERKRDVFKKTLRNLASLSLVDYKWRSALFKKQEADRMEEEWMAAMMGEDPAYARPMDAGDQTRGPLGNAEKSAVQWLMSVIEEEGRRARRIADSDGELVRPKDLSLSGDAGPLSELEEKALKFISEITDSEVERVRTGTMRPKDMKTPGPLGEAEARAVLALSRIVESEKVRMDQSRMRGGEAVRPIDVPGPLGELERYVGDIIRAERQRVKDREANEGRLVRPKDASIQSGLGDVERKAVEDWEVLRKEENERLFSLRRFLDERRPMETDKDSALGVTEAFTVGLLRGPQLFWKTMGRVKELMSSEDIDGQDKELLQQNLPASSGDLESESVNESKKESKPSGPSEEEDGTVM